MALGPGGLRNAQTIEDIKALPLLQNWDVTIITAPAIP